MTELDEPWRETADLTPYSGRWVALIQGKVVGQGGTPQQAQQAAQSSRHKDTPKIMYVPSATSYPLPPLIEQVRQVLPEGIPVYLVGGAVRDLLRQKTIHDLDFVLQGDALHVARQVADRLGGAYYPLHEDFNAGRVILLPAEGERVVLDFSGMRGADLEADLRLRDFTINAMALDMRSPQALLDPLGGAADLLARRIRVCSTSAFEDDPARVLRAVRQAAAFGFQIQPETRKLLKQAAPGLEKVSAERMRDELVRMLEGPQPAAVLRVLDLLGVLPFVLPELPALKGVQQSSPHVYDVWEHTLAVVAQLEALLDVLGPKYDPELSANQFALGLAVLQIGRYRAQISNHLAVSDVPERAMRPMLFLAAIYHDIAKPFTRQVDEQGRTRFFHHDEYGSEIVSKRGHALHLSNNEIKRVKTTVRQHMRPLLLSQQSEPPTRRAVYRFFRDTGEAGVDVCLLSLADYLATYATTLPQDVRAHHLEVVRTLLEAWWESEQQQVKPTLLLNGRELIAEFSLQEGRLIGELLEGLREAQAVGEVTTRAEAVEWIRIRIR